MYYKKKSAVNRRRKKRSYTKSKSYKSLDNKISKIQRAIEWKHLDMFHQLTASTSGSILNLTAGAQGDADNSRDGDKITTSSLQVRGSIEQNDVPYNKVRITVVRVPTNHWSTITKDMVYIYSHSTDPQLWMYNLDSFRSSKLKVMYDKCFVVKSITDSVGDGVRNFQFKIPFRYQVQYAGGTTACNQALYVFINSDSTLGPHPTVDMMTRLNYCDL